MKITDYLVNKNDICFEVPVTNGHVTRILSETDDSWMLDNVPILKANCSTLKQLQKAYQLYSVDSEYPSKDMLGVLLKNGYHTSFVLVKGKNDTFTMKCFNMHENFPLQITNIQSSFFTLNELMELMNKFYNVIPLDVEIEL